MILLVAAIALGVTAAAFLSLALVDAIARRRHWRLGKWSWPLSAGYGGCRRCETSWRYVDAHILAYHPVSLDSTGKLVPGRGIMALCEACHDDLGEPEARYPYYEIVLREWNQVYVEAGLDEEVKRIRREMPTILAAIRVDP